jgi:hypothetical protein
MNNYELTTFNYVKNDLKNIFTDSGDVFRPCTISELVKISNMLDMSSISRILYFSITPDRYHPIHIDKTINSTNCVEFALNIPITDCNKVYMNWFENLSSTHDVYYPVNKNHATPILETKNAKTIDTVSLNLPMFVKINDWHNVENRSNDVEKLISIRFLQSKTITDIKKALGLS